MYLECNFKVLPLPPVPVHVYGLGVSHSGVGDVELVAVADHEAGEVVHRSLLEVVLGGVVQPTRVAALLPVLFPAELGAHGAELVHSSVVPRGGFGANVGDDCSIEIEK